MQSRLIVKNFGPIDFVDLDLRNVNVFIGPQASGKSALAKLFTIFKAPRKFLSLENQSSNDKIAAFKNVLEEYNIVSFLKPNTEIVFESELHFLLFKDGIIAYEPKLLYRIRKIDELKVDFLNNIEEIKDEICYLFDTLVSFRINIRNIVKDGNEKYLKLTEYDKFININESTFNDIIDLLYQLKETESTLSTHAALYIPSERNFINIIKNSILNLMNNNVPIPKHILSFGAEVEKATINEIKLDFIQSKLIYKNISGEGRIFTDAENSIKLTEAASGIQSVLPILMPFFFHSSTRMSHRSFVIEEPELNLFPTAQYELIKLIESKRINPLWEDDGSTHTYTTHSPYILSALNNHLYAHKIKHSIQSDSSRNNSENLKYIDDLIRNIIPTEISPDNFTAYQIKDGTASSIFDREAGLIVGNYIDEASDKMSDDFDALTELMNK